MKNKKSKLNKKNRKNKYIGKPPAWIYHPAFLAVALYYRLRYRVSIDREALRDMPHGCVVLATHTSNKDHFLTAMAIWPRRVTFVMSEHFYANNLLRPILKLMRTIPKRMFCPDTRSVLNMIRAVREGNTLLLFPEGRLTWYGKSFDITPGTAELVRNLGVPVYTVIADGAGLAFPKWAKYVRRGEIRISVRKLFDGETVKTASLSDIEAAIGSAIAHNAWTSLPDVSFKCRDSAAGLDGILWQCPVCGGIHTLECANNRIICTQCGLRAEIDAHGIITGAPEGIVTVSDWYERNVESLDIDIPLSSECSVGTTDSDPKERGVMRRDVGRGKMTLSRDGFSFEGEVFGEKFGIHLEGKDCPHAFPLSVGDHFDIYYGGKLYIFSPLPDRRDAVIFAALRDKLTASEK